MWDVGLPNRWMTLTALLWYLIHNCIWEISTLVHLLSDSYCTTLGSAVINMNTWLLSSICSLILLKSVLDLSAFQFCEREESLAIFFVHMLTALKNYSSLILALFLSTEIIRVSAMVSNHGFGDYDRLQHGSPSPMASASLGSNAGGMGLAPWNGLQQEVNISALSYCSLPHQVMNRAGTTWFG